MVIGQDPFYIRVLSLVWRWHWLVFSTRPLSIPHRTRALHQSTESVSREFTSRLVSRDFELDGGGSGGAMLVVVGPSIKMS